MLLEPVAVGDRELNDYLDESHRKKLVDLHLQSSWDSKLPKVSSMSWLESGECLGCQAGMSFIYISAQGEVFPCDFVPISFGNVYEIGLPAILKRMHLLLKRPSKCCLALRLKKYYRDKGGLFFTWEQCQEMLQNYDPGPMPELFKYLCHGK